MSLTPEQKDAIEKLSDDNDQIKLVVLGSPTAGLSQALRAHLHNKHHDVIVVPVDRTETDLFSRPAKSELRDQRNAQRVELAIDLPSLSIAERLQEHADMKLALTEENDPVHQFTQTQKRPYGWYHSFDKKSKKKH